MATIREDVVSISFDVESNPFADITAGIDDMKAAVGVGVDKSTEDLKKLGQGAKSAADGIGKIKDSVKQIGGTSSGLDSLKSDIEAGGAAIGIVTKKFSSFKKALKQITAHPIKTLDNEILRLQMSTGRAVAELKALAKSKLSNLKSQLIKIKSTLTSGEAGAKGFVTSLKSIGKITVSKIATGIDKLKNNLQQGKNPAEKLTTALKKAAAVTFTKVTGGLKNIAKYAGKTAVTLSKGLVAGVGAATAAVGGLVTASVNAYADYEQLVGGVDTLFKGSSKTIQKYANDAYKTAGLSANKYMETVTSFSASLISSVGGDTKKAAGLADMAISDMSDNANKMGTDMDSIIETYQSLARGNFGMLDNLKIGYGGTKSEMQRLIKDAAKIDKSVDANSLSYGNMVKAIHAVQTKMGITGTTALEAEKTISGSLSALKASWSNMLTALVQGGGNFDQCLDNLVNAATTFGKNVIPVIKKALTGVSKIIGELAPIVAAEIPKLVTEIMPLLVNAGISMVESLINGIKSNITGIGSTATQLVTSLVQAIVTIIPQLITIGLQLIVSLAQGIAQQLPTLIPLLVQGILDLNNSIVMLLPSLIQAGLQLILGLAQGLIAALPVLISYAPQIIQNLVNGITQSLPLIINSAIQLIQMLITGLLQNLPLLIQAALQMINALVQGLITWLPIIIQGALSLISALVQGLLQNLPMLIQAAVQLISGLATGLLQNLPTIISMGFELIFGLVNGLINNIPLLVQTAIQLIGGIATGLLQNLPQILAAAIKIILALVKGLIGAIPKIIAAIPKIIKAITTGLKKADLKSIGIDLMKGFANGISSMAKSVAKKAKDIASGVADKIKGVLKINSPSKLTFGYGEFTGEGLALGMQKMKDKVTTAAQGLSTNVSTAIQPSVNTDEGLALGIQKMKDKVTTAAQGLSTNVSTAIQPSVNAYTPSGGAVSNTSNRATTNNFNPQFTLNMNGASATEANKHKVKQWVKESIMEMFESMGRVNPELVEV